jgi:hypothetical protein
MIDISLAAIPNQSVFVQLDDRAYAVEIHGAGDVMTASVTRDNVLLIQGARITPGMPLLPYRYQEDGNFLLLVDGGDLPDYAQFGVTQFLVYLSADELAELRA